MAAAGLELKQLRALLVEVTMGAGLGSIVTGELPPMPRRSAENVLAECGLLGTLTSLADAGRERRRWLPEWDTAPDAPQPWLFTAQQQRMSMGEMLIHEEHVAAAEAVDEDFFGNFS